MAPSKPFKVLLAIDGSAQSEAAAGLLKQLPWPANTQVVVLAVAPERWPMLARRAEAGGALQASTDKLQQVERASAERIAARVALDLVRASYNATSRVESGRPPGAIMQCAAEIAADLIVVGARGLSASGDIHLGSTAQELVNYADQPVLIVRSLPHPRVLSTLLAVDGSPEAYCATALLGQLPWPKWAQVTVVSVAEAEVGLPTGGPAEAMELPTAVRQAMLDAAEANARAATASLHSCAAEVKQTVRLGRPAAEILAAAGEVDAELLVLGARGHTRAAKSQLGGVAQRIVRYAPCSVLLVR